MKPTQTTSTADKKAKAPRKPARRAAPAPPVLERVRLTSEHTHGGKKLAPGAEITVHPAIAQWLRTVHAVAAPAPAPSETATTKKE